MTGRQVSSFTLTKPATWKPDAAAASKRFATLQQAAPKAAVQASISAVALDSPAQPDFEGLKQLLHEDLLVAAASSPPVLEKFAGSNSYLAKVVASLAAGEAPAPVSTYKLTYLVDANARSRTAVTAA